MPTVASPLTAIAINTTVTNIFAGSQYEYLPFNAKVEIAVVGDAAGATMSAYLGTDVIQQGGSITQKAAPINPVYPDDYHLVDVGRAGERLSVQINNGANAINVRAIAIITPL